MYKTVKLHRIVKDKVEDETHLDEILCVSDSPNDFNGNGQLSVNNKAMRTKKIEGDWHFTHFSP